MRDPRTVAPSLPAQEPVKKGLGSCSVRTSSAELARLRLAWYYNWKPRSSLGPVKGVEFVPMFWSAKDLTRKNLDAVRRSGARHVLGFNEPDMPGQSNMSAEECLDLWPQLMTLEQRLGSPAPADPLWLEKFLPEARRRGLRVDFVCVHRYPDISDPGCVDALERMLRRIHRKYRLPVWLTECGAADVAAWHQPRLAKPTSAMARRFMMELLALLERLRFVERYAWFADRVESEYRLGTLFHPEKSRLTPLGGIYRDAEPRS